MTIDKGIQIRNIYYMLTYAFNVLKPTDYEHIKGEGFDEIYDLFAELLIRGISFQLKQGLHKEYIVHSESLSTLRGKLDLPNTIKNKTQQKQSLACEFDELSENNLFNQIIKTTTLRLLKQSDIDKKRKQRLKKLMFFFSEVDEIDITTIHWTTLRFDRNSKTYQLLLYICYFILNEMLMTTQAGDFKLRHFSDENMNRLYEKFILEYYRKHHPELRPCSKQIKWNTTQEDSYIYLPIMKTDIFLQKADRTLIIDAKYYTQTMQQQYEKLSIRNSHLNQIYTYVTNYDIEHSGLVDGMLLYAKTQETIVPDGNVKLKDGNIIYFKTLDLNQDWQMITQQLEQIVKL